MYFPWTEGPRTIREQTSHMFLYVSRHPNPDGHEPVKVKTDRYFGWSTMIDHHLARDFVETSVITFLGSRSFQWYDTRDCFFFKYLIKLSLPPYQQGYTSFHTQYKRKYFIGLMEYLILTSKFIRNTTRSPSTFLTPCIFVLCSFTNKTSAFFIIMF